MPVQSGAAMIISACIKWSGVPFFLFFAAPAFYSPETHGEPGETKDKRRQAEVLYCKCSRDIRK